MPGHMLIPISSIVHVLTFFNELNLPNTYLLKEKKKSGHISNVIVCFIFVL
jgi:hypothetical protein